MQAGSVNGCQVENDKFMSNWVQREIGILSLRLTSENLNSTRPWDSWLAGVLD